MSTIPTTTTATQYELWIADDVDFDRVEHFDDLAAACVRKLALKERGVHADLYDGDTLINTTRARQIVAESIEPSVLTAEETGRLGTLSIPDKRAKLGLTVYRFTTVAEGRHVRLIKLSPDCKRETGDVYDVTPGGCDCGSHEFHGHEEGHTCKHVRACIDLGLLTDPDADQDDRDEEPSPETITEELLEAEARDGASLVEMMAQVRRTFPARIGDRVCELIAQKRQQEDEEAELDRQLEEAMMEPEPTADQLAAGIDRADYRIAGEQLREIAHQFGNGMYRRVAELSGYGVDDDDWSDAVGEAAQPEEKSVSKATPLSLLDAARKALAAAESVLRDRYEGTAEFADRWAALDPVREAIDRETLSDGCPRCGSSRLARQTPATPGPFGWGFRCRDCGHTV